MIYLKNKQYIYDPECNEIINVELIDIYEKYKKNRKVKLKNAIVNQEILQKKIKKLKYLIFEVTQDCNLRCKYCTYSGEYYFDRILKNKYLDTITARKAINYFYSLIKNSMIENIYIGFYGGEPFLNYKVIKDIVSYSKNVFKGWKINYTVTTNATILNDMIIEFLIKNNFSLLISLDGPEEIHDSKRVFPNNKGSYQLVIKNMKKIKKRSLKYFNERVSISSTYSRDLRMTLQHKFFSENKLVNKIQLRDSEVNSFDTNYYKKYRYNHKQNKKDFRSIFKIVKDKIKSNEDISFFEKNLINYYSMLDKFLFKKNFDLKGGTCLFDNRLFIDVDGKFHLCDKINHKFPFGDVDNGHNITKMIKLFRQYLIINKKHCKKCNYQFLCARCFIHLAKDGKFGTSKEMCGEKAIESINRLEAYLDLKKEGII